MLQRYVTMLENGFVAPPIRVADGILVEGNHRYVAGRIFGVKPARISYTIGPSQRLNAVPMSSTKVYIVD